MSGRDFLLDSDDSGRSAIFASINPMARGVGHHRAYWFTASTYTRTWRSRNAHLPRQLQRSLPLAVFGRTTSFSRFWRHSDYAASIAAITAATAHSRAMVGIIHRSAY